MNLREINQISRKLLEYDKARITEKKLRQYISVTEYEEYYNIVVELVKNNIIAPVKNSGSNGMWPPLHKRYNIIKPECKYDEIIPEIRILHDKLNIEGYLANPEKYKKHKPWVLLLDDFLKTNFKSLETPLSINERSFQVFKKDIENFILSIKQNIYNVDVEQYEALIKGTYAMLAEEYETMEEIQKMIRMAEEKIKEEFQMSKGFEQKLAKAKAEIMEIHHNIGIVITEQRDLILNRYSLTDLYIDTIRKSFEFSFEKRYDFEETVLINLERYNNVLDNCLSLLKPLFLPDRKKITGIGDIYEPQIIYKEMQNQDSHLVKGGK
ncbi:MAG: hypothetical protein HPY74_13710 [Firmicutes bacterium]|nr:hypothetical protein [Bacillota bacterium]